MQGNLSAPKIVVACYSCVHDIGYKFEMDIYFNVKWLGFVTYGKHFNFWHNVYLSPLDILYMFLFFFDRYVIFLIKEFGILCCLHIH